MTATWSTEQVLALAPDAAAAKAGREQARPRPWVTLGRSEAAIWGECQGSAARPYQVRIDLSELAFGCACPSRKQPCKHALGLLLLLSEQPDLVAPATPPTWVVEWLAERQRRAEERLARAATSRCSGENQEPAGASGDGAPGSTQATERRRAARLIAGLDDLERWLADVARRGLATVAAEPRSFWERPARRLVDAQAPGLARHVRDLADLAAIGTGRETQLLEGLGRLQLAVEGGRRLETLPAPTQADLRTLFGWPLREEDVLAEAGVADRWLVLGARTEQGERLRSRRTWLIGQATGRLALLLHFAHGHEPLVATVLPGLAFTGELCFYSSGFPLRAIIKQQTDTPAPFDGRPGHVGLEAALGAYAAALAGNPWLPRYPLVLQGVRPLRAGAAWMLRDEFGQALPLAPRADVGWTLMALSGGYPLDLFGEWDGDALWPLSVWAEERFITLDSPPHTNQGRDR